MASSEDAPHKPPSGRLSQLKSTSRAVTRDLHEDFFTVSLEKTVRGKLGFAYRVVEGVDLTITGVLPDGAADDWNNTCEPSMTICTGDMVVNVNQTTDAKAMVAELSESASVTMQVLRTGPRWHIFDGSGMRHRNSANKGDYSSGVSSEHSAPSPQEEDEVDYRHLGARHFSVLALAIFVPNLVVLGAFSDVGGGLKVFTMLCKPDNNMLGNLLVIFGSAFLVMLVVLDWYKWTSKVLKAVSIITVLYIICAGAVLKSRFYPFAPLVIVIFHIPVFYGILRSTVVKRVKRKSFYIGVTASAAACSLTMLGIWMVWMNVESWDGTHHWNDETKDRLVAGSEDMYKDTDVSLGGRTRSLNYWWDCDETWEQRIDFHQIQGFKYFDFPWVASNHTLSNDELEDRASACARIKTIWFLVWASPLLCFGIDAIITIFCLLNGVLLNVRDTSKLEKVMKQFFLMIAFLIFTMYVSTSVAGASMRLTGVIVSFCVSGLIALVIWAYLEIGKRAITTTMRTSKLIQSAIQLATSDWMRGMVIIGLNLLIPAFIVISYLNQKVRKIRGLAERSDPIFTQETERVLRACRGWNWASILIKANWLVIIYWTFAVGVAKWTYVFLSWLNETLLDVSMVMVILVFFVIGFTMFMLPPVPGIPVYICSGIILSARARDIDEVGNFWGGTVIAIFESLVLKICAVCGQYYIGYFLGKSVKVQQLIGVDTVPTRSIEKILSTRGLNLPKVSILVGGPDWPTSVLCGILKLNLCQCCLGTLPVIFVSSPCVIAGAFMANPGRSSDERLLQESSTSKEGEIWDTLSTTALALSFMIQLAGMILALYFIQECIVKNGDELQGFREEHAHVAELTRQEEEYNRKYTERLAWDTLETVRRMHIMLSTCLMLVSLFMFVMMDEACFRNFNVSNKISDPYDEDGLAGNALNIVLFPGWVATVMFVVACAMHFAFLRWASTETRKCMAEMKNLARQLSPGEEARFSASLQVSAQVMGSFG